MALTHHISTIVSLEKHEEILKKHTYGPNDARHVSFGLFLIVIAI